MNTRPMTGRARAIQFLFLAESDPSFVMAGLDQAIHVLSPEKEGKTWITGTSPVMTASKWKEAGSLRSQRRILSLRTENGQWHLK